MRDELRELVWLTSMVAELSLLGVRSRLGWQPSTFFFDSTLNGTHRMSSARNNRSLSLRTKSPREVCVAGKITGEM
jgi:hypothetical protein